MKRPRLKLVIPWVGLLILACLFRAPLLEQIRDRATLANDGPSPEVVSDMIEQASDPRGALLAAWNSGKVVHREMAIKEISRVVPQSQELPSDFENILLSGSFDPDMNVRESALGALQVRNDPALTALAAAQLNDADPSVRLLGVNHLRTAPANIGLPLASGMLDDPDLVVVGMSLKLLENWSGEKFGTQLAGTTQVEDPQTGLLAFPEQGVAKTKMAVERARIWWIAHQREFPQMHLQMPEGSSLARRPLSASDFQLATLDGQKVRLSDFRGKVVLINFWTTWCTACLSEMPELIALQKQQGDQLVILGVSLDFVPDDDGDKQAEPTVIRSKIARTIHSRGINYRVLLDEHNEVGGRFNGNELPTTVIVDAQGNIRRRFVGARSLPVFEAMIAEARQKMPLNMKQDQMNTKTF